MKFTNKLISSDFMLVLEAVLKKSPQGLSEYDLLEALKAQGYFEFLSSPTLPDELFQAHFLLFHALYLLQAKLLEQQSAILEIHTLKIVLSPYAQAEQGLQQNDQLMAYYLDLANLENTSEDDVYQLLASFWNKMNNFENRDAALAELGLKDPVADKDIKQEYRRLIMQHHPDRGGSTEKIQKLNDVIKSLLG